MPHPSSPPPSVVAPTNLRRRIYELLLSENERGCELPTQDDVRRIFGALSDDVDLHLGQLAREGLLILDKDGGNGISLVPTYTRLPEIGLLGKVARQFAARGGCHPRASIGLDLRGIGVPLPPGIQAVQVLDDRMIDADIQFGDIALIVNSVPIKSGSIVAVEEGSVVVLRRYVVVSGIPHFLAENSANPELNPAWNLDVQGVLWGLIRVEECRSTPSTPLRSKRMNAPTPPRRGLPGTPAKSVPRQGQSRRSQSATTPLATKPSRASGRKGKPPGDWPAPPPVIGLNETGGIYQPTQTRSERAQEGGGPDPRASEKTSVGH